MRQVAKTTPKARRIAKVSSAVTGVLLAIVATLGFSNAAFIARTDPSADNNWATAGGITLTGLNRPETAPMFSHTGEQPYDHTGQKGLDPYLTDDGLTSSIAVEYAGEIAADIRMFANLDAVEGDLADHTLVTVIRTDVPDVDDHVDLSDGELVYDEVLLSAMPTDWGAAAVEEAHWMVDGDGDAIAIYQVRLTPDDAPDGASIEDVEFGWEAHHQEP